MTGRPAGRPRFGRPEPRHEPDRVATRVSAYVYGDVLVLSALVALHPEDLEGTTGLAYVLGTTVSTYVAHLLAEAVGGSIRSRSRVPPPPVRHELRDAVPIASAGLGPALLMAASLAGLCSATAALTLAIGITVVRLAALGWVVGYVRGAPPSVRTFLAGVLLAVAGVAVALLKWQLTH